MPRHVVFFSDSSDEGSRYFYGRLARLREPIPGNIELRDARTYRGPVAVGDGVATAFRLASTGPADSDHVSCSVPRLRLAAVVGDAILDVTLIARAAWEGTNHVDVRLVSWGANKIAVIKAIREITGLMLKEAKDLCEATINGPQPVKQRLPPADAANAAKTLREAGATVDMVPAEA